MQTAAAWHAEHRPDCNRKQLWQKLSGSGRERHVVKVRLYDFKDLTLGWFVFHVFWYEMKIRDLCYPQRDTLWNKAINWGTLEMKGWTRVRRNKQLALHEMSKTNIHVISLQRRVSRGGRRQMKGQFLLDVDALETWQMGMHKDVSNSDMGQAKNDRWLSKWICKMALSCEVLPVCSG